MATKLAKLTAFVFFAASAAFAATITVSNSTPVNGQPITITANISGGSVDSASLHFTFVGGTGVETVLPMYLNGATATAAIPALAAGQVTYYVTTTGNAGESTHSTITIPAAIDDTRTTDCSGWATVASNNSSKNCANGDKWYAYDVGYSSSGSAFKVAPIAPPVFYFRNSALTTETSMITPSLIGGVETISFDSMLVDQGTSAQLQVQVAKVANPTDSDWVTVHTINYTVQKSVISTSLNIQDADAVKVRFIRTSYDSGKGATASRIAIDNITITPVPQPATEAAVYPLPIAPAHPVGSDAITLSCVVSNVTGYACDRAVKVYYKLSQSSAVAPSSWDDADLDLVDTDANGVGIYSGEIPALNDGGYLWYKFECAYDGFHYDASDNNSPAVSTAEVIEVLRYSSAYASVSFNGGLSSKATLVGQDDWEVLVRIQNPGQDPFAIVSGTFEGVVDDDITFWGVDGISTNELPAQNFAPVGENLVVDGDDIIITNTPAASHILFRVDTANFTYTMVGTNVNISAEVTDVVAPAAQTNGEKSMISAKVSSEDGSQPDIYVVFRSNGTGPWTTNELDVVSLGEGKFSASGEIPALTVGNVEYYILADFDGNGGDESDHTTMPVSEFPGDNRYTDMTGWVSAGGTNMVLNCTEGGQWSASGVALENYASRQFGNAVVPIMALYDYPTSLGDTFVMSPCLAGGVGTIYYESKLVNNNADGEIQIQFTTDSNLDNAEWMDCKTLVYNTREGLTTQSGSVCLNRYDVKYVRFIRTVNNSTSEETQWGAVLLDNIVISRPPADVTMEEVLRNPAYPSQDQDILVRCKVRDVPDGDGNYPTHSAARRVTVHFSHTSKETIAPTSWQTVTMYEVEREGSEDGCILYEGRIPQQRVGYIWYYYQCDYDGYSYKTTEDYSPNYLSKNVNTERTLTLYPADTPYDGLKARPNIYASFQVRPYRSRYAKIEFNADPYSLSVPEMTQIGDEQWQCVTLVTGASALTNYFIGYGYYVDDAAEVEQATVCWGENDTDSDNLSDPTLAGFLETDHYGQNNVTNGIVALNSKDYNGFYLYRLSTDDLNSEAIDGTDDKRFDYIVKKAVYQDFDEWTADPGYFESSLGGLQSQTYEEDFFTWAEDSYAVAATKDENFDLEPGSVEEPAFIPRSTSTAKKFMRARSRILVDRKKNKNETTVNKSLSLQLDGTIENSSYSLPYGLEKISFSARASIDDGGDDSKFALQKNASSASLPIYFSASVFFQDYADSKPYISYVFLYNPGEAGGWGTQPSWYELRVIKTDGQNSDNRIALELWRHASSGVETKLNNKDFVADNHSLASAEKIHVYAARNGSTLTVKYSFGNTNPSSGTQIYSGSESSTVLDNGGTFGFRVFDAVPSISTIAGGNTWDDGNKRATDTYNLNNAANWYNGGGRWTIPASGTTTISHTIPSQTITVYHADCVGEEYQAIADNFKQKTSCTVSTLKMANQTVEFKAWNKKFVQLAYTAGDGGVVLDNIVYSPWHAVTRCENLDYPAKDADEVGYDDWDEVKQQNDWLNQNPYRWTVLEGWTENSGAFGVGANLERSRANTNLVQGVVSPTMTNGIGSINFSYNVTGGKVVYGVERSRDGVLTSWDPIQVFTNYPGQSGERYVKVGEYHTGRIRVRVYGENDIPALNTALSNPDLRDCGYDPAWGYTDQGANILVDNLRAKDYPEDVDGNAWTAYNLRISDTIGDELIYNSNGRSCVLNNSATDGVYGAEEFNDDDPYLQSPPLRGVGVGEISFQYRLVPGTGSGDGHVIIKVAPDSDTPANLWKTLATVDVPENGTGFVKFDNDKFYDEENFVVRFYNSKRQGTPRVVIDNVLVTAPARPSFEFVYVKLNPGLEGSDAQPVVGTNVAVEAKVYREILNPKNIRIFCSWHVFDANHDDWGHKNWFNPASNEFNPFRSPAPSNTCELYPIGNRTYRTPDGSGIPAAKIDDVVEFVVWGIHADIDVTSGDPAIIQSVDTFECPEWYQVYDPSYNKLTQWDLNEDYADDGWSPYFWVFNCKPNTFFVNEVKTWVNTSTKTTEYFEFLGPAGTDVSGWYFRVDEYQTTAGSKKDEVTVPAGSVLSNDGHGWGYFIWGDECMTASEGVTPNVFFNNSLSLATRNLPYSGRGGTLLVERSNGMVAQMIAFGTKSYINNPIKYGYEHISGNRISNTGDTYSLVSILDDDTMEPIPGSKYSDFEWHYNYEATAGAKNGDAQVLTDIGSESVTYQFISVLHDIYGTQQIIDGTSIPVTTVIRKDVLAGQPLTVGYMANDWYRIDEIESNGYPLDDVGQTPKSYIFTVNSMNGNISNEVYFTELSASERQNCPTEWLSQWSEEAIDIDTEDVDEDGYSLFEEYLLNTCPTNATTVSLKISDFSIDGDGIRSVTTELLREESGVDVTKAINGDLMISGAKSLDVPAEDWKDWRFSGTLFSGHTYTKKLTSEAASGARTNNFFRSAIVPKE